MFRQVSLCISLATFGFSLQTASGALVGLFSATNYSPGTGVWTDTSGAGHNATQSNASSQYRPTLTTNATPSGQSAVTFASNNFLDLGATTFNGASFTSAPSFSLFAVVSTPGSGGAQFLLAGNNTAGAFGYRVDGSSPIRQTLTKINQADVGTSTSGFTANTFHVIDITYGSGTYTFRQDGVVVGTGASNVTFNLGPELIGTGSSFLSQFHGQIADLRLYDSALDANSLASVENSLMGTYITGVPEPGAWGAIVGGSLVLVAVRRCRRPALPIVAPPAA